jgi:myosin heavy subunit
MKQLEILENERQSRNRHEAATLIQAHVRGMLARLWYAKRLSYHFMLRQAEFDRQQAEQELKQAQQLRKDAEKERRGAENEKIKVAEALEELKQMVEKMKELQELKRQLEADEEKQKQRRMKKATSSMNRVSANVGKVRTEEDEKKKNTSDSRRIDDVKEKSVEQVKPIPPQLVTSNSKAETKTEEKKKPLLSPSKLERLIPEMEPAVSSNHTPTNMSLDEEHRGSVRPLSSRKSVDTAANDRTLLRHRRSERIPDELSKHQFDSPEEVLRDLGASKSHDLNESMDSRGGGDNHRVSSAQGKRNLFFPVAQDLSAIGHNRITSPPTLMESTMQSVSNINGALPVKQTRNVLRKSNDVFRSNSHFAGPLDPLHITRAQESRKHAPLSPIGLSVSC